MTIVNGMSVDVEDYFQVSAFENHIDRSQWDKLPLRVERNCERIFELFNQLDIKATFFVLGWIAERCPNIVKTIVEQGHELASHGYGHHRIPQLTPKQFEQDVTRTKHLLEDLGGVMVKGYRAPSYSINKENYHWALEILLKSGYRYSSSIYPIQHDLYGIPEAPRFAFQPLPDDQLMEIPCSTIRWGNRNLPCSGGGYFRLLPYWFSRWAIARVNAREQQSTVFYFHPWEIDALQPRQNGISLKTRVRHYVNLNRMHGKLARLLKDFSWGRMDHIFLNKNQIKTWSPALNPNMANTG